jgi:hypothetical protein
LLHILCNLLTNSSQVVKVVANSLQFLYKFFLKTTKHFLYQGSKAFSHAHDCNKQGQICFKFCTICLQIFHKLFKLLQILHNFFTNSSQVVKFVAHSSLFLYMFFMNSSSLLQVLHIKFDSYKFLIEILIFFSRYWSGLPRVFVPAYDFIVPAAGCLHYSELLLVCVTYRHSI